MNRFFRAANIRRLLSIITLTSWDTMLLFECMNVMLLHHHNRKGGFLLLQALQKLMLTGLWVAHGEEERLLPFAVTRMGTIWAPRLWFIMV